MIVNARTYNSSRSETNHYKHTIHTAISVHIISGMINCIKPDS